MAYVIRYQSFSGYGFYGGWKRIQDYPTITITALPTYIGINWVIGPGEKDMANSIRASKDIAQGWWNGATFVGTTMHRGAWERNWDFIFLFKFDKKGSYPLSLFQQRIRQLFPNAGQYNKINWNYLSAKQWEGYLNHTSFVAPYSETPVSPDQFEEDIDINPDTGQQETASKPKDTRAKGGFDISKYFLPISIGVAGLIVVIFLLTRRK
jgi:hypothetical protein